MHYFFSDFPNLISDFVQISHKGDSPKDYVQEFCLSGSLLIEDAHKHNFSININKILSFLCKFSLGKLELSFKTLLEFMSTIGRIILALLSSEFFRFISSI